MNGDNERPVVCPRNPIWLDKMLAVLSPGLRGKLAAFEGCVEAEKPEEVAKVVRPIVKR